MKRKSLSGAIAILTAISMLLIMAFQVTPTKGNPDGPVIENALAIPDMIALISETDGTRPASGLQ